MKTLKSLFTTLLVVAATMSATLSAKTLTAEQIDLISTEINKKLPMDVEEGMTLAQTSVNPDGTGLLLSVKINPGKMGLSLDEAKAELNSYFGDSVAEMFGDEVTGILRSLGCDITIVFEYPDKTVHEIPLK